MDESYLLPASVTGRLGNSLIAERQGVVGPASGWSPDGRGPARCGTAYSLAVLEFRTKPALEASAVQSVAGPASDGR